MFFLILRSKIRKNMSPSKEFFAAAGGEKLFTQPQILFPGEAADTRLCSNNSVTAGAEPGQLERWNRL